MKEQIIRIPDNLEVKEIKDGKIILVEKGKKLTYEDVSEKLFLNREVVHFNDAGEIETFTCEVGHSYPTNCTSEKQAEKLLAINKLMNVAKWLNDGWEPDWDVDNPSSEKYYIFIQWENIGVSYINTMQSGDVYFKSRELAEQAIEILGEETIKIALRTDY